MELATTAQRRPQQIAVARPTTQAGAHSPHAAPHAATISRRKFLVATAIAIEAAKEDASIALATLDAIDFVDDLVSGTGPVETHAAHLK